MGRMHVAPVFAPARIQENTLSFLSLVVWISLVNFKQGISLLKRVFFFWFFQGFCAFGRGRKSLVVLDVFLGKYRKTKERTDKVFLGNYLCIGFVPGGSFPFPRDGFWRLPNPPGANPLEAERALWWSSQSCVTRGQQPIGNPYRFLSFLLHTWQPLCDPNSHSWGRLFQLPGGQHQGG